jgi:hypothetical protein
MPGTRLGRGAKNPQPTGVADQQHRAAAVESKMLFAKDFHISWETVPPPEINCYGEHAAHAAFGATSSRPSAGRTSI